MVRINNNCSIYIRFGNGRIKLPVNPQELEIKYPTNHKKYDVLGTGEIVIPRKPSLMVVSWECFFPEILSTPYVNGDAREPDDYVEMFKKAWKKKQKCRLIISQEGTCDTNIRCVISDFQTKYKGGEPGDIYYSVEFTEYRDYSPETVSVVVPTTAPESVQAAAVSESSRPVETPVLRVGASVIANGKYWYDSYGSRPFGTANNLSTTVTRIVSGNPYPVHIGSYGWLTESQLQIVG